ncbi:MAG: hypothetical protein AAF958_20440, partial [Planctomycetota bacterium]
LMLMRRKIVAPVHPSADPTRPAPDPALLRVQVVATGDEMDVAVKTIPADRVDDIRESLLELLYTEAGEEESEEDVAPEGAAQGHAAQGIDEQGIDDGGVDP